MSLLRIFLNLIYVYCPAIEDLSCHFLVVTFSY